MVQPFWMTGGNGTSIDYAMLLVSNPQANSGTASTDSTGTNSAGTHPSNWGTRAPTAQIVYAPSPTLGTKPVLRIGKRTANVGALTCESMGAYVDYTPGYGGGGSTVAANMLLLGVG